ncbi:mitochondrial import inner membrane translocase subunit tim-54 [Blumeria hordei DH14]|uniref:Mitochondrial import inner membrane translocase subunit TIM54 n=1 Tax=Blumeria graminis f. sp. hordei (strain DH14) TaxID=546991 RepID=N1JMP3_BLUG1|nr:mitochondrial import inner membrane translocase subunit tim-54 [Blumeria hordei DH14]
MAESKRVPDIEEQKSLVEPAPQQDVKKTKPTRSPNPMWKYMGFGENFQPRLPSRNWMIFLSLSGSFVAAVVYDKREKKRNQRKWCKLVEHVAMEPLHPRAMPRKLSIFLEAPPYDGLRVAQDHFKDYVKPILVSSGLDWEFVQGRKEGDIRAEVASRIRNARTHSGRMTGEDDISRLRAKNGIADFEGPAGDIVIGRHTWKEYVRGVHEGWLGPLTKPDISPMEGSLQQQTEIDSSNSTLDPSPHAETTIHETSDQTVPASASHVKTDEVKATLLPPAAFIQPCSYSSSYTPSELPIELDPSVPIPLVHILGFLNTPRRLYRFLNRRALADEIGRETAAVVLSNYRPYHVSSVADMSIPSSSDQTSTQVVSGTTERSTQIAEQQLALECEEKEWHKSVWVRADGEPERTWLEPVRLDPRIASRMRRFELSQDDELRAKKIHVPEVEIEGWIKGRVRKIWETGKAFLVSREA